MLGAGMPMDGKGFISDIENNLVPISPIIGFAIKKQLADIGTTTEDLNPNEAMDFIDNMTEALDLFLGKQEATKQRKFMLSLLWKYAPEYFEEHSPV